MLKAKKASVIYIRRRTRGTVSRDIIVRVHFDPMVFQMAAARTGRPAAGKELGPMKLSQKIGIMESCLMMSADYSRAMRAQTTVESRRAWGVSIEAQLPSFPGYVVLLFGVCFAEERSLCLGILMWMSLTRLTGRMNGLHAD